MPILRRNDREEFWNCLTHSIGCVLSVAGALLLATRFFDRQTGVFVSVMVFAILLIAVYACSALSHFFLEPKLLSLFRRLDQAFIYLLIVGSYTPFSVAHQPGIWWWTVLGFMWLVALTGFFSKLIFSHRVESVAIWIYLLLGWTPVISGMPFAGLVPLPAVALIVLGGVFYTGGTYFLFNDYRAWYYHSIWHLFVIAGSVVHFIAVLMYV